MTTIFSRKKFCCLYFCFVFCMSHEIPFHLVFSFSRGSMHFSPAFHEHIFSKLTYSFYISAEVDFRWYCSVIEVQLQVLGFISNHSLLSFSFFRLFCYSTSIKSFTVCLNRGRCSNQLRLF